MREISTKALANFPTAKYGDGSKVKPTPTENLPLPVAEIVATLQTLGREIAAINATTRSAILTTSQHSADVVAAMRQAAPASFGSVTFIVDEWNSAGRISKFHVVRNEQ